MAVKGLAYVKTAWSFEERPVASSKLNTWDDRIEGAVELVFRYLHAGFGNSSGVLRIVGNELKAQAAATPRMSVQVVAGDASINGFPYRLLTLTDTVDVVKPVTHNRIDLVQASLAGWTVTIKTGAEAASPVAPAADTDCIALARLYLRPAMTVIKNADDGTNGYIIDVRSFL